jgi:hypothetical protein
MIRLVQITILAAALVTVSPVVQAQDCSNWGNWDLRGTYAMSGSGWIDLSKLVSSLPAGSIPMSWVGAVSYNGSGAGAGWVSMNAGGVQLSIRLIGLTYAVKADCSVQVNFSMQFKELPGVTVGPVARVLVIAGKGDALELFMILGGIGPGSPVDSALARRISMQP